MIANSSRSASDESGTMTPSDEFEIAKSFQKNGDVSNAFEWLHRAASHGSAEALFWLGTGHYDRHEFSDAMRLFYAAAEKGLPSAQYNLAVMLMNGQGTPRSPEKAVTLLREAAHAGMLSAQSMLGNILCQGDGVTAVPQEGFYWLNRAAIGGDVLAQLKAARMKYEGQGVPQSYAEAYRLFNMAAEKNVAEALFNVADMLENGNGAIKDTAKAIRYYERAHELRFVEATHRLALVYHNGRGVPKDERRAIDYWRQAAECGHSKSKYCLACALINSLNHDPVEVFRLLADSSRSGHSEAANTLIRFVADSVKGRRFAFSEIRELDSLFAELKLESHSQFLLARLYLDRGTQATDHAKAMRWLVAAADSAHCDAQLLLGSLHFTGSGVDQNFERAFDLFSESAQGGHETAKLLVAAMSLEGLGTSRDVQTAVQLWSSMAEAGSPQARLHLAVLFEIGVGVERDPSRSLELLASTTPAQLEMLFDQIPDESRTSELDKSYNLALKMLNEAESLHETGESIGLLRSLAWRGYVPSLMMLGHLYQAGIGVERSCTTALEYFAEAARLGYSPARQLVQKFRESN